jgi:hypothetical protein
MFTGSCVIVFVMKNESLFAFIHWVRTACKHRRTSFTLMPVMADVTTRFGWSAISDEVKQIVAVFNA